MHSPLTRRITTVLVGTALATAACSSGQNPPPVPPSSSATPTATPETPDQIFERVRSGVVRIQTVTCDGISTGTGFLVGPQLVATVAHVVDGAASVSLRSDKGVVRGTVVGMDPQREVPLVRAEATGAGDTLKGNQFTFATAAPKVGQPLFVLGYPLGRQLSMTQGSVTSLEARIDVENQTIAGLLQHDAAAAGGNSGGPVLNAQGEVVGLHEAGAVQQGRDSFGMPVYVQQPGIGFAVPATVASGQVKTWSERPVTVPAAKCPASADELVKVTSTHAEAPVLARTLLSYFGSINVGDYGQAWQYLGPPMREPYGDLDTYGQRQSTTEISDVVLQKANLVDVLTDTANVSYTSHQEAADGSNLLTCTKWHQEYTLRLDSGYWRIEKARDLDPVKRC